MGILALDLLHCILVGVFCNVLFHRPIYHRLFEYENTCRLTDGMPHTYGPLVYIQIQRLEKIYEDLKGHT